MYHYLDLKHAYQVVSYVFDFTGQL